MSRSMVTTRLFFLFLRKPLKKHKRRQVVQKTQNERVNWKQGELAGLVTKRSLHLLAHSLNK